MTADGADRRRRFPTLPEWVGPATRLLHGAREPELNSGALVSPIFQTSTFHFPAEFSEAAPSGRVHLYTRHDNPTQIEAAEAVRSLEGAAEGRVFASGMGAISATLLALTRPGDTVVALEDLYGGTLDLLSGPLSAWGLRVHWVTAEEARSPETAIPHGAKLAWIESPTNPLLRAVDIRRWATAADANGTILVVDNTFATPINQRPLSLGADVVVHSATKYLGGHHDLVAGVALGPSALIEKIDAVRPLLGAPLDPFAAFLLSRGLKTLPLRVAQQNATARALASALRGHPAIRAVHYPGSHSPEEEGTVARQMSGRGGLVSLELAGGARAAREFLHRLKLVHVAASLGGVESVVSVPGETSHVHLSPEELARRGIAPGLVRLSVGLEETDDLVRDVRDALGAT